MTDTKIVAALSDRYLADMARGMLEAVRPLKYGPGQSHSMGQGHEPAKFCVPIDELRYICVLRYSIEGR